MKDWEWMRCEVSVDEYGGGEDSILIRCDKPAVYVTDYGNLCEEHAPKKTRFVNGNDIIDRLAADPFLADDIAAADTEVREAT